mmetsp:Transcript_29750/g.95179  ORF Transcript_29750/g.95179 Transcript_29750/m.95179 type:complete len:263 (-) Transcript_29750:61-849(-)
MLAMKSHAVAVSLLLAIFYVLPCTTQVPYIQGSWIITYKFVELKGDRTVKNACRGPFPYYYTWTFDICQSPGSANYIAVINGAEVATPRYRKLIQATPDAISQNCKYSPTTYGPAGVTQDWALKSAPGYPSDNSWQNWRPRDVNGKETEPITFSNFQLPTQSPFLWGDVCHQYDWQDTVSNSAGISSFYRNAWRHENDTWIFIQDACNCKGGNAGALQRICALTSQGGCNEKVGTITYISNPTCVEKEGISINECPYSIAGL